MLFSSYSWWPWTLTRHEFTTLCIRNSSFRKITSLKKWVFFNVFVTKTSTYNKLLNLKMLASLGLWQFLRIRTYRVYSISTQKVLVFKEPKQKMLAVIPSTNFYKNSDIRNEVKLWIRWLQSSKKLKYNELQKFYTSYKQHHQRMWSTKNKNKDSNQGMGGNN